MTDEPAFQRCLEAFLAGDHATCVKEGLPLLSRASPQLFQFLLISIQRQGKMDWADRLGGKALADSAADPWANLLLRLTLGKVEPAEVLIKAISEEQHCQAHYYRGARLRTLGQMEEARAEFVACLASPASCLEHRLAESEIASLPPPPPPAEPEPEPEVHTETPPASEPAPEVQSGPPLSPSPSPTTAGRGEQEGPLTPSPSPTQGRGEQDSSPPLSPAPRMEAGLFTERGPGGEGTPSKPPPEPEPEPPPPEAPEDRLSRLNKEVLDFCAERRFRLATGPARQACALARQLLPEDSLDLANTLRIAIRAHQGAGNNAEVVPLLRQAIDIWQARGLPTIEPMEELALAEMAQGNLLAVGALRQRIEERRPPLPLPPAPTPAPRATAPPAPPTPEPPAPPAIPDDLNLELQRLSAEIEQLARDGRYPLALGLAERASELTRQRLGASHPAHARVLLRLAELHEAAGDYSAAEAAYLRALEALSAEVQGRPPDLDRALRSLTRVSALRPREVLVSPEDVIDRAMGAGLPETPKPSRRRQAPEMAPPAPAPMLPPIPVPAAPPPAVLPPAGAMPVPASKPETAPLTRGAPVRFGASATAVAPRPLTRRATARYYSRMAPRRIYPLMVVISEGEIRALKGAEFDQAASEKFKVTAGSVIAVEPVLAGCACYPPRQEVLIREGQKTEARFYVTADIEGKVPDARVVLWQGGQILAEVRLRVKVGKPLLPWVFGLLAPATPMLLKYFKIDLEQLGKGTDGSPELMLYKALLMLAALPWWVPAAVLGGLALVTWWWLRPRPKWSWEAELVVPKEEPKEEKTES